MRRESYQTADEGQAILYTGVAAAQYLGEAGTGRACMLARPLKQRPHQADKIG